MADCYLFPVFHATSAIDAPLSVLEAMACNLPIVTTRFGALPGMFQSGNGFYYGDTEEEIVRMVKQAVEEQDCRTFEMVSPYSWDNAASTILETLQETRQSMTQRALLICFTGIDGSGKTTQAKLLVDWLASRGIKSMYVWSRGEVLTIRSIFLLSWGEGPWGLPDARLPVIKKSYRRISIPEVKVNGKFAGAHALVSYDPCRASYADQSGYSTKNAGWLCGRVRSIFVGFDRRSGRIKQQKSRMAVERAEQVHVEVYTRANDHFFYRYSSGGSHEDAKMISPRLTMSGKEQNSIGIWQNATR